MKNNIPGLLFSILLGVTPNSFAMEPLDGESSFPSGRGARASSFQIDCSEQSTPEGGCRGKMRLNGRTYDFKEEKDKGWIRGVLEVERGPIEYSFDTKEIEGYAFFDGESGVDYTHQVFPNAGYSTPNDLFACELLRRSFSMGFKLSGGKLVFNYNPALDPDMVVVSPDEREVIQERMRKLLEKEVSSYRCLSSVQKKTENGGIHTENSFNDGWKFVFTEILNNFDIWTRLVSESPGLTGGVGNASGAKVNVISGIVKCKSGSVRYCFNPQDQGGRVFSRRAGINKPYSVEAGEVVFREQDGMNPFDEKALKERIKQLLKDDDGMRQLFEKREK